MNPPIIQVNSKEISRFWRRVDKSGPTPDQTKDYYIGLGNCWVHMGAKDSNGYGQIFINGRQMGSHRASWIIHHGPIPDGFCVLHKCDNPSCVRPDHLFMGSHSDNAIDKKRKRRCSAMFGDSNPARRHPERMARGERHSSRTHPGCLPSGDNHHFRKNPNLVARGESAGNAKLTSENIIEIRFLHASRSLSQVQIGRKFGVSGGQINRIVSRKSWAHI